jgi:cytoplasmic iron level regulating protein YaaA (DUF328/UPF0246 family)
MAGREEARRRSAASMMVARFSAELAKASLPSATFDRAAEPRYRAAMLVLLSPAKTLDFDSALPSFLVSTPHFANEARNLARSAANLSQKKLSELMHISPRLARLNAERFRGFADLPERPALFAFAGDVYTGFEAHSLDEAGIAFAQEHVRMLSGLYGLLRPLDAIRLYRLEMGTRWGPRRKKLTDWWGDRIADLLRAQLAEEGSGVVLNLASQEYFTAVAGKLDGVRVIDVDFRELGPDGPRFVSFNAKRARGMMARWLCEHHVSDVEAMRGFGRDGYRFDPAESDPDRWRFNRS